MDPILRISDLHVSFHVRGGEVQAVRGFDLEMNRGESVAIVGESGSGKSVTAQSILRLIPTPPGIVKKGSIEFMGQELLSKSEKEMEAIRGKEIGMIFQDPMTSLNPTLTVGRQISEVLIKHQKLSGAQATRRAAELLTLVGIPNAEARVHEYPHQFSGGMRQRVMIAIALACDPALLIADEPTTALDVTIQAQIMQLMKDLQKKTGTSIILITHDLGIVADMCDRVIVMYAGKVVETGTKHEIFRNPQHPYTKGLLRSLPRLDQKKDEPLIPIIGTPPDMSQPPQGCAFCARCDDAMRICVDKDAPTYSISHTQTAKCWLHDSARKGVTA